MWSSLLRAFLLKSVPCGSVVHKSNIDPSVEAASIPAQVIILNHAEHISAGCAPDPDCHTSHIASQCAELKAEIDSPTGKMLAYGFVLNSGDVANFGMVLGSPMSADSFSDSSSGLLCYS